MVAVVVVLAAVCLGCLVTLYVTHRMLRGHREIIAAIIGRRAADLSKEISDAEGRILGDTAHRLGILAQNVEGLADATRAVLMHKTVIAAQQDRDQPSDPAR